MSIVIRRAVALGVLLLAGCTTAPGEDGFYHLQVGRTAQVSATFAIRFLGVPTDTRCPVDVVCVQAGNAEAQFEVSNPLSANPLPPVPITLNTTEMPWWLDIQGYRVTLKQLQPERVSGTVIPPNAYVAVLDIKPLEAVVD
ncbi:MAG: hypothetical protein AB7Q69_15450 [Gemmatimonadales bacterium]